MSVSSISDSNRLWDCWKILPTTLSLLERQDFGSGLTTSHLEISSGAVAIAFCLLSVKPSVCGYSEAESQRVEKRV